MRARARAGPIVIRASHRRDPASRSSNRRSKIICFLGPQQAVQCRLVLPLKANSDLRFASTPVAGPVINHSASADDFGDDTVAGRMSHRSRLPLASRWRTCFFFRPFQFSLLLRARKEMYAKAHTRSACERAGSSSSSISKQLATNFPHITLATIGPVL